MLVGDAMRRDPVAVYSHEPVQKALDLMVEKHIGCVIVADREKCLGILTERDLMERVFHPSLDPEKTPVADVMSAPLATIDKLANMQTAVKLMGEKKIKKLGVTHTGKLVGIITYTDIIRTQPELVQQLMDTWLKPEWRG